MIAFLLILVTCMLLIVIWTIRNGISPMPTSGRVKKALLKAIPKDLQGTIVELGSGWGTLVFPIAKEHPGCQVMGYETSPIPYYTSCLIQSVAKVPNIALQRRDFFEMDLSKASLLICYLYPGAMQKLKLKFDKELKSGCRIYSHTFAIPGLKAEQIIEVNDLYKTKIYCYKLQ